MNKPLNVTDQQNLAPANAIEKSKISAAFSNSAASYDSGAALQRRVGNKLLAQQQSVEHLVDLGTGPGYFTSALHDKSLQLTGVDIAPQMLAFAKERNQHLSVEWLLGDAEALPLEDGSVDGIFSSLMLQWVHDLSKALSEAYRVLSPGSEFNFSTLLDGTLFELVCAWQQVDDSQHVNTFLTKQVLEQIIDASEFELASFEQVPQTLHYDSVIALMRDLKAIGANNTANKSQGLMGRSALKKLDQGYEAFRTPAGLTATYQVAYCRLIKPI